MIYGVILAGGKSSRMNENKMLVNLFDKPVILHAIESLSYACEHIIVVTGKYDKEIREALKDIDVEIVTNKDYEKGMFSSVLAGIQRVNGDFLLLPGDCPIIKKETIDSLLKGKEKIRVPAYKGKNGHPIYISYEYKDELLSYPLDFNLKSFRENHKYEIIDVEDENIVINLNTVLDVINFKTERK